MPPRNLVPQYAPQAQVTDPYYGDYSALAQQFLKNKTHPVYSAGQGIAEALGDVGEAYFEKEARKDAEKKQAVTYAQMAQAFRDAASDKTAQQIQAGLAGNMQAPFPTAQQTIPTGANFSPAMDPQSVPQAQQGFGNSSQQRAMAALMGIKDPAAQMQAMPMALQTAQSTMPPSFTGTLKPGESAFIGGKRVAGVPEVQKPGAHVVGNALVDDAGREIYKGQTTDNEPLVQVPDPKDPTKAIYVPRSKAVGQQAFQTPRERNPKMQTYYSEDGSTIQLDSNDPEDQRTIKDRGLVSQSPTDPERVAKGFLDRMQAAEPIMGKLVESGFDPSNFKDNVKSKAWGGNYFVSDQYRQYRQAQEDWVRAKLRKESGAVIGDDEMEREIKTYFPQPGDDETTKQQKTRSRLQAEKQLATTAGLLGRKRLREIDSQSSGAGASGGWSAKRIDD